MAKDLRDLVVQGAGVALELVKRAADVFKYTVQYRPYLTDAGWLASNSTDTALQGNGNNILYATTARTATEVWGVGTYRAKGERLLTLVQLFNGATWALHTTPNPYSGDNVLLEAVALSATDVWAAGYGTAQGVEGPLVLHYDGTQWLSVPVPAIGNSLGCRLTALAGRAANAVYFVGYYIDNSRSDGTKTSPLVLKWDGTTLGIVGGLPAITAANSYVLQDCDVSDSGIVLAVGSVTAGANTVGYILRFDTSTWAAPTVTNPAFGPTNWRYNGVASVTGNTAYLVGEGNNGSTNQGNIFKTTNGTTFPEETITQQASTGTAGQVLKDIVVIAANNIFAVGYYANASNVFKPLAQRWTAAWALSNPTAVGAGDNQVWGVSAADASNVYAVGYYVNATALENWNLALKWNNTAWATASPAPTNAGTTATATAPTVTFTATPGTGNPSTLDVSVSGGASWEGFVVQKVVAAHPADNGGTPNKLQRFNIKVS